MINTKTDVVEMLEELRNTIENMTDENDDRLILSHIDENLTDLVDTLLEKFSTREESSFSDSSTVAIPFSESISNMTEEELYNRDQESHKRYMGMRAEIPVDIAPMPTPQEQLRCIDQPPEAIQKIMELELKYGIGKGIDLFSTYKIRSVEYIFDRISENNDSMDQLRIKQYSSCLAQRTINGLIYVTPLTYLSITYPVNRFDEAVSIMSKDLILLANGNLFFGHLSMPKVLELNSEIHTLYCWPFVDLDLLAKSMGKDYRKDFNFDQKALLESFGLKSVCHEGNSKSIE